MKTKRFLSVLLMLCMAVSLLPIMSISASAEALTGSCGDNATWTLDGGTLTISGSGAMYDYVKGYVSPAPAGEKTPWYSSNSSITNVVVESGITYIGNNAFAETRATSITIPEGVTAIGEGAFAYTRASSITLPDSLGTIGTNAFLESYIVTINIPANVTSLGETPFFASRRLTAVTVDSGNSTYFAEDGVLYQGTTLIAYPLSKSGTEFTIKDGTTAIARLAIWCNNLTKVTIPTSLNSIGSSVFSSCDKLTAISYGGTQAQWNAISGAGEVSENVAVVCTDGTIGGTTDSCGENATWKLENGTLTISGTGAMKDYDSASDAPWYNDKNNITKIVIGNGITSIGKNAFYNFYYLTDVSVPDSLTSIGTYAFGLCNKIASIDIPETVTTIQSGAFMGTADNIVVNYGGTKSAWESISVNAQLSATATINYGKFEVSFDANGGTGTMAPVASTGTYTLPENGFTAPTGKEFKGWTTTADGIVIDTETINVTANTTLYAVWGDKATTSTTKLFDDDFIVGNNVFSGTNLNDDGYTWDGTTLTLKDIHITGYLSFYYGDNYTIVVDGDNVTIDGGIVLDNGNDKTYTIKGATTDKTANVLTDINGITSMANNLTIQNVTVITHGINNANNSDNTTDVMTLNNADVTCTSSFEWRTEAGIKLINNSILTVGDGGLYSGRFWTNYIDIAKGSKIKLIDAAYESSDSYRIENWFPNASRFLDDGDTLGTIMSKGNYVLQWHTQITFDANGGTGTATEKYYVLGEKLTLPTLVSIGFTAPAGKNFKGWATSPTATTALSAYTVNGTDTTLYAVWSEPVAAHVHNMTATAANDATCTVDGNTAYWTCTTCGKYFSDADGNTEIAKDSWIIPATGHDPSTDYSTDDSQHWKVCNKCSAELDNENHKWDNGVVTTPATESTEGVKTYTCTVCKLTKTEKIDKLPSTSDPTVPSYPTYPTYPSYPTVTVNPKPVKPDDDDDYPVEDVAADAGIFADDEVIEFEENSAYPFAAILAVVSVIGIVVVRRRKNN